MLSFPSGTHLGVECLDHMAGVCLTFQKMAKLVLTVQSTLEQHRG